MGREVADSGERNCSSAEDGEEIKLTGACIRSGMTYTGACAYCVSADKQS
jgi:hypothetical protein